MRKNGAVGLVWFVCLAVLAIVLNGACRPGLVRKLELEAWPPLEPSREFKSELALNVYARLPNGMIERIGRTPADLPVQIPECRWWAVRPLEGTTPSDLAREVTEKRIPGLRLGPDADTFLSEPDWLEGIKVLELASWEWYITDATLARLEGLPNLRELSISRTGITNAGLAHLKGLKSLRALTLDSTSVTDDGLAHLKGMTNLRELELWGVYYVTDAGLAHLKGLTNLRTLHVAGPRITDVGLAHLKELTNLRELKLVGTIFPDASLAHLKGMTNLQILNLSSTLVTDEGLAHLKALMDLRELILTRTQLTDRG